MGSSSDNFCLRWNDFESNISSAFQDLRNEEDFFDVTLATSDDFQVSAHKLILSACSPFFKSVLKRNPHQKPLLYLRGIHSRDLLNVLNFMYHGQVNVHQDDLNTFLAVAEDLSVKGLTVDGAAPAPTKRVAPAAAKRLSSASHATPVKRSRKHSGSNNGDREETPHVQVKTESSVGAGGGTDDPGEDPEEFEVEGDDDYGGVDDGDDGYEPYVEDDNSSGAPAGASGSSTKPKAGASKRPHPILSPTSSSGNPRGRPARERTLGGVARPYEYDEKGTAQGKPLWTCDGFEYTKSRYTPGVAYYLICRKQKLCRGSAKFCLRTNKMYPSMPHSCAPSDIFEVDIFDEDEEGNVKVSPGRKVGYEEAREEKPQRPKREEEEPLPQNIGHEPDTRREESYY